MIYHETPSGTLHQGEVLDILRTLPDESVNCCVTSPPYWGLRDYGHSDQLGLERTPEEYVARMVEIFREVRRVLRKDGTLWLNLGDSYVSGKSRYSSKPQTIAGRSHDEPDNGKKPDLYYHPYLKDKDLCGIPWRVAFALQADGWWLRQDIIWHKPNPMPESVRDRCTKSHEYIFMLTKSARYYFDSEAIKEPANYDGRKDTVMKGSAKYQNGYFPTDVNTQSIALKGHERWKENADGVKVRNKRSVWTVTTKPYKEAHFATYPPDLILPCVKAAKPDAVILDPFFGSGTTGLVAVQNGRRYIGIDLSPEYCAIAAKRIDSELQQANIFREMTYR